MLDGLRTTTDDLMHAIEHLDHGEYSDALRILSRVVAFEPANVLAYELWVMCHMRLGRMERALELADIGLSRGMRPAILNVQKSGVLRHLQRFDDAAEAAKAAMAADPESSAGVRALAAVEIARGSRAAAIRVYQEALERLPDDGELHFQLVKLASESEQPELVISTAREFLRRFDRDPEILSMLGHAYVAANDLRKASRAFRDAAQLEPDDVERHVDVLMASLLAGNEREVESYLERLRSRDPELAEAVASEVSAVVDRLSARE